MTRTTYNKSKITKIVEWNTIIFECNTPNIDEWNISEDFDYQKKEFVSTIWVFNLIDTSEFEKISSPLVFDLVKETLKKRIIWEIISSIYERAKYLKLDYLQKLSINWTSCWCIDNGNDICLMLPDEY